MNLKDKKCSFFRKLRVKYSISCDSFHHVVGSFVFTVPRSTVPVSINGRAVKFRPIVAQFVVAHIAQDIYGLDSSICDFDCSEPSYDYAVTAKNILSGFIMSGVSRCEFTYFNVDRACDCVSTGVIKFSVYDAEV